MIATQIQTQQTAPRVPAPPMFLLPIGLHLLAILLAAGWNSVSWTLIVGKGRSKHTHVVA